MFLFFLIFFQNFILYEPGLLPNICQKFYRLLAKRSVSFKNALRRLVLSRRTWNITEQKRRRNWTYGARTLCLYLAPNRWSYPAPFLTEVCIIILLSPFNLLIFCDVWACNQRLHPAHSAHYPMSVFITYVLFPYTCLLSRLLLAPEVIRKRLVHTLGTGSRNERW